MKLNKIINEFKNKYRKSYNAYFYKFIIFKSYLKNLNFFSYFLKIKLLRLVQCNQFINNKKIKKDIILIVHSLSRGGAEKQVVKLANLLIKKKFKVKIIILDFNFKHNFKNSYIDDLNKKISIEFIEKSKNFNKTDITSYTNYKNLDFLNYEDLYMVKSLTKLFERNKYSIIHSFLDDTNIIVGLAAMLVGKSSVILSLRSAAPWRFTFYKSYWKECYRIFAKQKNIKLVCNSKLNAIDYENWLKIKKNSIKVTYNIFDFKYHKHNKRKNDKNKIVFGAACRLAPEKNLFFLLKIFKLIAKKNFYLEIQGKGYLKNRLINYSKKIDNIRFLGETNKINNFFNKIDVFILTSHIEGTPNVILEAQNQGLPILTTNVGGISECVIKDYTCFFIDKKDPKKAAKEIIEHIKKKSFFEKKDIYLIKKKLIKFSSEEIYKKLIKIYGV